MADQAEIEALIARLAMGDREAFSLLYDATSSKLFSVCLKILHDQPNAEDALQDTYIKIWKKADQYHQNGMSPMTWMITIARNTSIDRLRTQRKNHHSLSDASTAPDELNTPESLAMARSDYSRLEACLDELEKQKADAVRDVYFSGFYYAELASRYNIPLNTVRTWLRRSLLKLKGCLSND